jgi:hypothetical protein
MPPGSERGRPPTFANFVDAWWTGFQEKLFDNVRQRAARRAGGSAQVNEL